jgi:hypothetical protein
MRRGEELLELRGRCLEGRQLRGEVVDRSDLRVPVTRG